MHGSDPKDPSLSPSRVTRRRFIKTAGATALAVGGIEGILAARRAPAFAQGTKLHWVRWVDFIPESDVELKRQMPEASKALGAEVTLETINANDLQARITAAIQSGSGADIFIMLYNWAQLYGSQLVDVSDLATALARSEGGFYDVWPSAAHVGGHWLAVPHSIIGNADVARGGRRSRIPEDLGRGAEAVRPAQAERQAVRPDPRSHIRRRPDLLLSDAVVLRRRRDRQDRQEGRPQQQGRGRGGEVHAGVLEGVLRRGRPRVGRHEQQPRLPRRRDLGDAQRRVDLHRGQAPAGEDQGREGRAHVAGHRPPEPAGRARGRVHDVPPDVARDHEVLEEPEAREGLPALAPKEGELREVVRDAGGLLGRRDEGLGAEPRSEEGRQAAPDLPDRRP